MGVMIEDARFDPPNATSVVKPYVLSHGTLQVYNRFRTTAHFTSGHPWLLRFFDQIRFYPVSADELTDMRRAFSAGRLSLDVSESTFRIADYHRFLDTERDDIAAFRAQQRAAFEAERQRWVESGQHAFSAVSPDELDASAALSDEGPHVSAHVPGSVWKVVAKEGTAISAGDPLVVLESMKMEITVSAPHGGRIGRVLCREGQSVSAGQPLVTLET